MVRIDTPEELVAFRHGGILPYVLRQLVAVDGMHASGRTKHTRLEASMLRASCLVLRMAVGDCVITASIKAKARELGFDLCGVAPAERFSGARVSSQEWLARGYAGDMAYMPRSAERRADVRHVLPVRAERHRHRHALQHRPVPYSTECRSRIAAHIARYAWGDDYHDVLKARLDALLAWMRARAPSRSTRARTSIPGRCRSASTRSTPASAGSARTRCLINPRARLVAVPRRRSSAACRSTPTRRRSSSAGRARCCLDACPTRALVEPGVLDSTRCISYLTIELRGADSRRASRGDRHPRVRLRHLPGSVPVEPAGAGVERSGLAATAGVGGRPMSQSAVGDDRRGTAGGDAGSAMNGPRWPVCVATSRSPPQSSRDRWNPLNRRP